MSHLSTLGKKATWALFPPALTSELITRKKPEEKQRLSGSLLDAVGAPAAKATSEYPASFIPGAFPTQCQGYQGYTHRQMGQARTHCRYVGVCVFVAFQAK